MQTGTALGLLVGGAVLLLAVSPPRPVQIDPATGQPLPGAARPGGMLNPFNWFSGAGAGGDLSQQIFGPSQQLPYYNQGNGGFQNAGGYSPYGSPGYAPGAGGSPYAASPYQNAGYSPGGYSPGGYTPAAFNPAGYSPRTGGGYSPGYSPAYGGSQSYSDTGAGFYDGGGYGGGSPRYSYA